MVVLEASIIVFSNKDYGINNFRRFQAMVMPSVTFETKCWEEDWEIILKTRRLEFMIGRNVYPFDRKTLLINNVKSQERVSSYAQKMVAKGILTDYYLVQDYEKKALDFFCLSREDLGAGYYYSIAELVGLYVCQTVFLLHFSSDSIMAETVDWITPAIHEFERNEKIKVANPVWSHKFDEAQRESFAENHDFFNGYGFSDQCYLVRTSDFRDPIFGEKNILSERYPKYGGELFEKRVDSWMRNHGFYRVTYKRASYVHKNYEKRYWRRRMNMLLRKYD